MILLFVGKFYRCVCGVCFVGWVVICLDVMMEKNLKVKGVEGMGFEFVIGFLVFYF